MSTAVSASVRQRLLAPPATSVPAIDLDAELEGVLATVGLRPGDAGGSIRFRGADPVLPSTLRLAGATALALAAKSVAVAAVWRLRGGGGQDIDIDLRQAPHRLCPFHDGRWELLNGYPYGDPAQVTEAFGLRAFYRTADGRWVHALNPYPRGRQAAQRLLDVPEDPQRVAQAVAGWSAADLEAAAEEHGVTVATCRSVEEFVASEQFGVMARDPLVRVERIGESEPEPWAPAGSAPLDGLRVLERAHVIAGAGCGRALALHGADVLNVWDPAEYEIPTMYLTANVGVRSTTLDLARQGGASTMRELLRTADVFVSNRRPGYLARHHLDARAAAEFRPGIVHASVSLVGDEGPWARRVGFDQTAGALTGVLLAEGTDGLPSLPPVPVVNDYITAWLLELGILAALRRRAEEGGSYAVSVSLTRTAMWVRELGTFERELARATAGSAPQHTLLRPELFIAETVLGRYQGVAEQVRMSATPGSYARVLGARGADRPGWLDEGARR